MNLIETKCKRCGKVISTMTAPIHSSMETMKKWSGICAGCLTEKEKFQIMLDMNGDIRRRTNNG